MKIKSLEEFYKGIATHIPVGISKEIGHFNVFKTEELIARYKGKPFMPYNRGALQNKFDQRKK